MALHYLIRCASCGETFEATRSDADTCSGRCRARLSRERRAARQAEATARTAEEIARATALLASLIEETDRCRT